MSLRRDRSASLCCRPTLTTEQLSTRHEQQTHQPRSLLFRIQEITCCLWPRASSGPQIEGRGGGGSTAACFLYGQKSNSPIVELEVKQQLNYYIYIWPFKLKFPNSLKFSDATLHHRRWGDICFPHIWIVVLLFLLLPCDSSDILLIYTFILYILVLLLEKVFMLECSENIPQTVLCCSSSLQPPSQTLGLNSLYVALFGGGGGGTSGELWCHQNITTAASCDVLMTS